MLEVFHMRCLYRILGTKWSDLVDNNISNKKARVYFNNIREVKSLIIMRLFTFFERKVIRIPYKKILARLLSAFCRNKIPLGRSNTTVRYSMVNNI